MPKPPHGRRTFLKTLGLTAAGAFAASSATSPARSDAPEGAEQVTIDRIEFFPVRYPTVGRFKFFEGPPGTPEGRAACLVKITSSTGAFGWGESVPIPKWSYETLESATTALETYIAPILIGMDPFDLHGVHAAMNQNIAASFSTGMPIAKAGIDLALHDLWGAFAVSGYN